MAILAAAESGDLAEARRLRARWGRTHVRDWASDVAVLVQAENAVHLGDDADRAAAIASLLPYAGRQAVLGTPSLSLGSYDELLGRLCERCGDLAGARRWWLAARDQGARVACHHQVALAQSHLDRVSGDGIPAPRGSEPTAQPA
jgi:hypothetical protein